MYRHSEGFLCFQNTKPLQGYKRKRTFIDVYKESNFLSGVKLTKFTHAQQQYVQVLHTEFHPDRKTKWKLVIEIFWRL
jgi:hypothetical protein